MCGLCCVSKETPAQVRGAAACPAVLPLCRPTTAPPDAPQQGHPALSTWAARGAAYSVGVAPGAVPGAAGAGPAAPFSTEAVMAASAALFASLASHRSAKSRPSGASAAVTAGSMKVASRRVKRCSGGSRGRDPLAADAVSGLSLYNRLSRAAATHRQSCTPTAIRSS